MRYFDSQLLTVEDVAVQLDRDKINNIGGSRATMVLIQVKNAPVNYTFFGSPPTVDASYEAVEGETFKIEGYDNIIAVNFIQLTDLTAELYISYGN